MALLRVTGLSGLKQAQPFSENWQAQLKGTQELWHNCSINIYKEVRGKFDPETGETPVTEVLVYSGKARVQPVRASRDVNVVDDRTTQQVARFQISDTSVNLTPDMWVKVTEARGPAISTNTYPTPSFELPGSPVVVATNLCPNPTAVAGGATIGSPGNASSTARMEHGVTLPEPTPNGTTTGNAFYIDSGISNAGVVNPDGISTTADTLSMMVYSNVDAQMRLGTRGTPVNVPANTWTQLHKEPGAPSYLIAHSTTPTGTTPTDRFYYTEIRSGSAANVPWFFPGTSSNPDLTAAWTGPPHNSSQTLTGVRVLGVDGVGHQSTQWAASGSHSLRLLEGEYADIGTGPIQFKARELGQLYLVDSVPHIAVEGVNRVESGLVSLGPGWWDDVSTAETWFYPPSGDGSIWNGTPDNSPSELYSMIPGSTLNPSLSRYRFKLREIVDSGNLIERTFEAVMDNESQTS